MSHTPAPWIIDKDNSPEHGCCYEYTVVSSVENKSYGKYPSRVCEALSIEDAQLIAAAPELLSALKMCLNGGYKYKTIEAMARATINKAEGK